MKICLFDWNQGGHHAEFAKTFVSAASPGAEVVLAAPDGTLESIGDAGAKTISLGSGRPRPSGHGKSEARSKSDLAEAELDLIEEIVGREKPDHLILLWADPVLRWLLKRGPLPTSVSAYLFFAPLHYPTSYGTRLSPGELASALYKEANVLRWARRPDSHALFAFDPVAARRWARYPWVNSHYLPEPPLSYRPAPVAAEDKNGCLLFGYLDARKGIDRIATALEDGGDGLSLKLYGEVAPEYRAGLDREVERMRMGDVEVETRLERLPYEEALDSLARARVALLAFGWVPPGSRVLLEAASAGTPVVGSSRGAVGHLIRENNLGLTVDPDDPEAMRSAIRKLALDGNGPDDYAESLSRYADELNANRVRAEIRRALDLPVD